MAEKAKEHKEKYLVEEISTQTALVIKDRDTDQQYNLETALVKILNNQEKILSLIE